MKTPEGIVNRVEEPKKAENSENETKSEDSTVNSDLDVDLSLLLSEATEIKEKKQNQEESQSSNYNPDDFEETVFTEDNEKKETPISEAKPIMSYDEQSEMLIAFVDGLQALTLPWLYGKVIFTKEEKAKLKIIKEKLAESNIKNLEEYVDKENLLVYQKYARVKELENEVPFSNQEVKMIKGPLKKVMEKYNWNVGPEMMLVGALFTVVAPRFLPLFSKLEE